MTKNTKRKINTKLFNLNTYLFLYLIIWVAYFFKVGQLGLYEDDTRYIITPANSSFNELLALIKYNMMNIEGGQGRFIGFSVPQILAYVSFQFGGLTGIYVMGTLIILLNCILLYKFALRFLPTYFALLVSVVFLLYPADTTKPLLIHIFQLQISLSFVLLALNVYMGKRWWFSYILAFCCLLTYEVAFLPFLLVPLFKDHWNWKKITQWLIHVAVCFGFLGIIFLARKLMGESRVSEIEGGNMPVQLVLSLFMGPAISAKAFFVAAYDVILNFKTLGLMLLSGLILFGVPGLILFRQTNFDKIRLVGKIKISLFSSNDVLNQGIRLFIAAMLMLMASYVLAFVRFPPNILYGRATSVHLASSVAGSLLVGIIFYLLRILFQKKFQRTVIISLSTLMLTILFGKAVLVQEDMVQSWRIQKDFWTQTVEHTPDAKNNTLIIASVDNLELDKKCIYTYSWSLPEVYEMIMRFDPTWDSPPKVIVPGSNYDGNLLKDNKGIYFEPQYAFLFQNREKVYLEDNNVIYLEFNNYQMTRIDTVFSIDSTFIRTMDTPVDQSSSFERQKIAKYYLNN